MSTRLRFLLIAVSALALAGFANGAVLFDNLGGATGAPPYYADSVSDNGPLADSFSTGTSAFLLTDVEVKLTGGPGTGSVTVELYSDNAGVPGTSLGSIGTVLDTALPTWDPLDPLSSFANYDIPTSVNLDPGTRYWLVLVRDLTGTGTITQWAWSYDTSGTGVAGEYYSSAGSGVFPNLTDSPYQMRISGEEGPAGLPEPISLTLVGVGLIGLSVLRRRLAR